jgi:hypothetical protein
VIWLGERRGFLTDWGTQRWVQITGRRLLLEENLWLDGPVGNTRQIGKEFFLDYARQHNLQIAQTGTRGLVEDLTRLSGETCNVDSVAEQVRHFYECTSNYSLDSWSQWHGLFRPFGHALAILFSRRLQQLNIPLSPLDSAHGMTSDVIQMRDPHSNKLVQTAWVRQLTATRNVLYAGSYSICKIPGHPTPCVKVVFPLPNGNAIVVMRPEVHPDGSFSITSSGKTFGDPGFYFTVHAPDGTIWARYLASMKEIIHVYAAESNTARADHILWLWGKEFLRLHYRMQLQTTQSEEPDLLNTGTS